MATASDFSVGLAHKMCVAAAEAGWTPKEFNLLAQDTETLRHFHDVHLGLARIEYPPRILDTSKAFDPVSFIGEGWKILEQDKRALNLTTVNFAQARFEHCLEEGETTIKGEEKLLRLKQCEAELIRHGGNQFQALWRDYQENGDTSVLEFLRKTQEITYLDFFGLILRYPYGDRYVLYLYWLGGEWLWNYRWFDNGWDAGNLSVVSPTS